MIAGAGVERRQRSDWWVPTAVGLSLLAGSLLMASRNWVPVGDVALMELRLQAMPEDMPLVGVYSRFGWWHPGPAFLVWSWLGYIAGGASSASLLLSIAVLHVVVLVAAWWLARQVNVVAANALLLAGVTALLVRPIDQVLTPWNPYVGLVGVLLLVAAGWGWASGRPASAFLILPWGSFLVQSHVGYAPVVVAVVLTAAALMLINGWYRQRHEANESDSGRAPWRALLWGVAVSVLLWLPPLFQQLTVTPGNLGALATQVGGETQGLAAGVATVRAAFTVPMDLGPDFTGGLPATTSGVPWLLLLPVAALLMALARRRGEQITAMVLIAAVLVAAVVSVAGVTPPAFEYLVPWLPSVVLLALIWSTWVLLDPLLGNWRWWSTVVGAAAVAVSLVVAVALGTSPPPLAPYGTAAQQLWQAVSADAAAETTGTGAGQGVAVPITVVGEPQDESALAVAQGMVALANSTGADVALDEATSARVEGAVPADSAERTRYVVRSYTLGQPIPVGERVVATYDPFTTAQWAELTRIDAELAAPGIDPLKRLALATQRAEITGDRRAFEVLAPQA